jgi:excisionase family DNA binding protein
VYIVLVTVAEAAAYLVLSPATVRRQILKGRIRARKVGRDWDIDFSELQRYRIESLGRPGRRAAQPTLGLIR